MSNDSKNNLTDLLKKTLEMRKDLEQKALKIKEVKINSEFQEMERRQTVIEKIKEITIDEVQESYYDRLSKENQEYLELAKNAAKFINEDFDQMVPFFPRNIILIGGKSGRGKSTTVANLAYHTIVQKKKVLIVSNEEKDTDIFNRITCLIKGWAYVKHNEFTSEQQLEFNKMYRVLGERITIINDDYKGVSGMTTTLEGFNSILKMLKDSTNKFDLILIDYFQNFQVSHENPYMDEWKVLDRVAAALDQFKNVYPSPIVLFAQLKENAEENVPFKERIERSKSIFNKSTCALELVPDVENRRTIIKCHKSRWTEGIGKSVNVGFKKGMFVKYTPEFANMVEITKEKQKHSSLLASVLERNKKHEESR